MPDERERQTSNKAGLRSLGKKLGNSRYGFGEQPASRKTAGAFGRERGMADESEERAANREERPANSKERPANRGE